jgi:hypothetical protein
MVSIKKFRELALAFDEAKEVPHFEKTSFRVTKKIFATLDEKNRIAVVKLPPFNQNVFCVFEKGTIYPVPGKWGLKGWTMINLKKVLKVILLDVLRISYCNVAPKKLAGKYGVTKIK